MRYTKMKKLEKSVVKAYIVHNWTKNRIEGLYMCSEGADQKRFRVLKKYPNDYVAVLKKTVNGLSPLYNRTLIIQENHDHKKIKRTLSDEYARFEGKITRGLGKMWGD